MNTLILTSFSFVLTGSVVGNAYYQKKQFYPSVVYLTKSNPSMAAIYLQAFVIVLMMGKLMRKVFFGQLRVAEVEHLIERSWYAVTETCLAFTVFRDDFSPKFVALFTLLLFLKCFHWLAEDRVDFMERSPIISWLFHLRVVSLLFLLGSLDLGFVIYAYYSTIAKGASVQLVFGFEYAILWTIIFSIFVKYLLHTIDIHSENPGENKSIYLLYSKLVMGFVKVILYLSFMTIMIKFHTFPLFAVRPMYLSIRSFKKVVNDVIMSRRAIRNVNTLYPNATAEDLRTIDNVCIICREEMTGSGNSSKKLPCNHMFHTACLRSWFQRQQTCPICRMDVLRVAAVRASAATPPPPPHPPTPPNVGPPPQPPPPTPPFNWNQFPPQWIPTQQQQPEANAAQTQCPNRMPFRSPMPPFPFLPLLMPPPPQLPTSFLQSLSDEELRTMEGQTRSHLEARIGCLQNIQTLLDAASIQMKQYTNVMMVLDKLPQSRRDTSPPPESTSSSRISEESQSPAQGKNCQEELRRRRLQKFDQPPPEHPNELNGLENNTAPN